MNEGRKSPGVVAAGAGGFNLVGKRAKRREASFVFALHKFITASRWSRRFARIAKADENQANEFSKPSE
jgi:hypothetical protein